MNDFTPEPGRIVMVRYDDGEAYPAIIVRAYGQRIKAHVFLGDEAYHFAIFTGDPAPDAKSEGWYRPGQWPQPTVTG